MLSSNAAAGVLAVGRLGVLERPATFLAFPGHGELLVIL